MSIPTNQEQEQAKETLAYIRDTMDSASRFTAVSGWGLAAVGVLGIAAAAWAWAGDLGADLRIWIPTALLSVLIAIVSTISKARRMDVPIWSGAIRKLAWVMAPALIAGAMLTFAMNAHGAAHLLPGMWLALYGAGVTAGGTFSVRAIRWMGVTVLVLSGLALYRPEWGLLLLGAGFGALHVVVGLDLVVRHGG